MNLQTFNKFDKIQVTDLEKTEFIGKLIFEEILKDKKKHSHTRMNKTFFFNRIYDNFSVGKECIKEITIEIISMLNNKTQNNQECILKSKNSENHILIRLPDHIDFLKESEIFVKIEKLVQIYKKPGHDSYSDLINENIIIKEKMILMLTEMFVSANYYIHGILLSIKGTKPLDMVSNSINCLIKKNYSKFDYLDELSKAPAKAIRLICLNHNQQQLFPFQDETRQEEEIICFIDNMTFNNKQIILDDLNSHFFKRPYGWPKWQTTLSIVRLFSKKCVYLSVNKTKIGIIDSVELLTKQTNWKNIEILQSQKVSKNKINKTINIACRLFNKTGPWKKDTLYRFLRNQLLNIKCDLESYLLIEKQGIYPGKDKIVNSLNTIYSFLKIEVSEDLIKVFLKRENELTDLIDEYDLLTFFYQNKLQTWKKLVNTIVKCNQNRSDMEMDSKTTLAFDKLNEIIKAKSPYNMLNNIDQLIDTVGKFNDTVETNYLNCAKSAGIKKTEKQIANLTCLLNEKSINVDKKNEILSTLNKIKKNIQATESIKSIEIMIDKARDHYDLCIDQLE